MRIQTSDFGAPPERMHVFARVISIRPETVRNTPPPLDPVLNTYMHGGQHYHRMVLRLIRWGRVWFPARGPVRLFINTANEINFGEKVLLWMNLLLY